MFLIRLWVFEICQIFGNMNFGMIGRILLSLPRGRFARTAVTGRKWSRFPHSLTVGREIAIAPLPFTPVITVVQQRINRYAFMVVWTVHNSVSQLVTKIWSYEMGPPLNLLTLFRLFVTTFTFGLHGSMCSNLPWGMIQTASNVIMCILCFVASICVAADSKRVP